MPAAGAHRKHAGGCEGCATYVFTSNEWPCRNGVPMPPCQLLPFWLLIGTCLPSTAWRPWRATPFSSSAPCLRPFDHGHVSHATHGCHFVQSSAVRFSICAAARRLAVGHLVCTVALPSAFSRCTVHSVVPGVLGVLFGDAGMRGEGRWDSSALQGLSGHTDHQSLT